MSIENEVVIQEVVLADATDFTLGGIRIIPAERLVEGDGLRQELQPRVMQVLVALAQERPRVLSRDRLVDLCWGGRVVGDDALNRCILVLRHMAKSVSPEPFEIETVPRVGYRLVEKTPTVPVVPEQPRRTRWLRHAIVALTLIAALVLAGGWWWQQQTAQEPATIAVLPFSYPESRDRFFAEGVGEEILNQLAGEPSFRVVGRMSSARYRNVADLREVGRALGVNYVLEGSVLSETGKVRVNASLVQTRDGMRLWSQSYDRKLDDILDIQRSIGQAVAGALSRKLQRPVANGKTNRVDGEVYRNYLSARGMLQQRNPLLAETAIALLRTAVKQDPAYAPAWASLAQALRAKASIEGEERVIAILPRAEAYARRALALEPNLAEAHGVLGMLLGYRSREAQLHLRQAAALGPRNAEAQIWLASAENVAANYESEIKAYRRAIQLEPDWFRPTRDLAVALAEMGERDAALKVIDSFSDVSRRSALKARIAWLFGDFAYAAHLWASEMGRPSIWQEPARVYHENARFTLGLPSTKPPRPGALTAELRSHLGRVWMSDPPSLQVWKMRNRSAAAALVYEQQNRVAAKLMLNAGRGRELISGYDGPVGLLGLRRGITVEAKDLHVVALVALALRQSGRSLEADQMLGSAQVLVANIYRRGRVPFTFDVDAATIAAAAGQTDGAIAALERARLRGWSHAAPTDLLSLDEEPAFAPLHGRAGYQKVAALLRERTARERAKAIRLSL